MPQGEIHAKFFKSGYLIIIPEVIYLLFLNPLFAISVFFGYSLGRYFDPDLDIASTSSAEGRMMNELKILGYVMYAISSFYGAVFRRRHRSVWTHYPVISTIIRLIFFFFWIPLLFAIYHWTVQSWELTIFFGVWFSLSQADMIHWLADCFWSEDSKRWVQQDKEKKWRNSYSYHNKSRTRVTHLHRGTISNIDDYTNQIREDNNLNE
jgi:uncharacterized metal-binding protein